MLTPFFRNLRLDRIQEFHLQTRSWHEIEFRNISLHRGQKTNFAIFIDGKPYAEPTNATRSEAIDALPKTDVGIGRSRRTKRDSAAAIRPTGTMQIIRLSEMPLSALPRNP